MFPRPPLDPSAAPLLTQGPRLAPTTPATTVAGPSPQRGIPQPGATKSRACGQEAFITTWTDTAVRDTFTTRPLWKELHVDSSPMPAKVLTTSPRRRLGNHLMKRMIWGVFSINQKKCTLK